MNIHESAEDYLEAILKLQGRLGQVRAIDIAAELNFTKASVSIAMKNLRENGYVEVGAGGSIHLLAPGQAIADRIYTRHRMLTRFLVSLGVDAATAAADACKIEHDLSDESFAKLQAHAEKCFPE